jgi:hypothetical protein
MTKDAHPVADAFAHLHAVLHESDVVSMPQLLFRSKEDYQRVLRALQNEVGGDPAYFDALHVISMPPRFYDIEMDYPNRMLVGRETTERTNPKAYERKS